MGRRPGGSPRGKRRKAECHHGQCGQRRFVCSALAGLAVAAAKNEQSNRDAVRGSRERGMTAAAHQPSSGGSQACSVEADSKKINCPVHGRRPRSASGAVCSVSELTADVRKCHFMTSTRPPQRSSEARQSSSTPRLYRPPTACTGKSRPPSDARTQLFLEIVGAHQHHRSFPVPLEEGSQGCFGLAATATRTGVVCAALTIASAPADGHVERLAPRSQIQAAVRCIWQKQSAPLQDHRDTALRPRLPGQGPRTFCLPYTPS